MAQAVGQSGFDLAVVDTLKLPGAAQLACPGVLVLRETPDSLLAGFRRDDARPRAASSCRTLRRTGARLWTSGSRGRSSAAVGILRPTGARRPENGRAGFVVATGGGGTAETGLRRDRFGYATPSVLGRGAVPGGRGLRSGRRSERRLPCGGRGDFDGRLQFDLRTGQHRHAEDRASTTSSSTIRISLMSGHRRFGQCGFDAPF